MKYALVKPDGTIRKRAARLPFTEGTDPRMADGLEWIPITEAARPAYDAETHRLKKSESRIDGEWVIGWVPVDLSVHEKRDRITSKAASLMRQGATINGKKYAIDGEAISKNNGRLLRKDKLTFPTRVAAMDGTYTTLNSKTELSDHDDAMLTQYAVIEGAMIDELQTHEAELLAANAENLI